MPITAAQFDPANSRLKEVRDQLKILSNLFGSNILEMLPHVIPVVTKCDPSEEDGHDLDSMKNLLLTSLEKVESDQLKLDNQSKFMANKVKLF